MNSYDNNTNDHPISREAYRTRSYTMKKKRSNICEMNIITRSVPWDHSIMLRNSLFHKNIKIGSGYTLAIKWFWQITILKTKDGHVK